MILLGLTGGIASGKSTVNKMFELPMIDLDVISREIFVPGHSAYKQTVAEFGKDILNE
eukprot:CAMPEP_0168535152 /NCGR_PEP_ID=MMETSP0405-20121227/18466_1 /TAXON_ID=498012 /ORGANISM="Trichosphaerium sp, Strain Am-I-7 wt" /LENGTH=57 /DNA_ID=CAMNT_0008562277 /DNA_START=9 /DNA_END=179 /DNA_ORIENTATION=-